MPYVITLMVKDDIQLQEETDTTYKRLKSTSESPGRKYIGEINTSSNRCENSCGKTITLSKYAQSVFNTKKNIYKKLSDAKRKENYNYYK